MNIVYGAAAIIISLFLSTYLSKKKYTKVRMFLYAFSLELCAVIVLGCVFRALNLGFFAAPSSIQEDVVRILGLAVFLGVLVGMRTVNLASIHSKEREMN